MVPKWIETDEIFIILHLRLFVCQVICTVIGCFIYARCCKWWEARRARTHLSSDLHGSAAHDGGVNAHPPRGGGANAHTSANTTQTWTTGSAARGGGGADARTNANATQTWTQMPTLTWTQPHRQTRTQPHRQTRPQPQMFASLMIMQGQRQTVFVSLMMMQVQTQTFPVGV